MLSEKQVTQKVNVVIESSETSSTNVHDVKEIDISNRDVLIDGTSTVDEPRQTTERPPPSVDTDALSTPVYDAPDKSPIMRRVTKSKVQVVTTSTETREQEEPKEQQQTSDPTYIDVAYDVSSSLVDISSQREDIVDDASIVDEPVLNLEISTPSLETDILSIPVDYGPDKSPIMKRVSKSSVKVVTTTTETKEQDDRHQGFDPTHVDVIYNIERG